MPIPVQDIDFIWERFLGDMHWIAGAPFLIEEREEVDSKIEEIFNLFDFSRVYRIVYIC